MLLTNISDLNFVPNRIISLVPSQTELLYSLGLDKKVAGITKFCVHPQEWFRSKTRIGGTKNVFITKVHNLQPDLIIANREENVKQEVEELAKHYPVWVTDVNNLDDALEMIADIGNLTGTQAKAISIIHDIKEGFSKLTTALQPLTIHHHPQTCYLIWQKPYMAAGGNTFINSMLQHCGFKNIFEEQNRYPELTIEELKTKNCELLLLSSEPYPFKQKHIGELQQLLPACKIILADGEMFSWYGSRLLHASKYFLELRHSLV